MCAPKIGALLFIHVLEKNPPNVLFIPTASPV